MKIQQFIKCCLQCNETDAKFVNIDQKVHVWDKMEFNIKLNVIASIFVSFKNIVGKRREFQFRFMRQNMKENTYWEWLKMTYCIAVFLTQGVWVILAVRQISTKISLAKFAIQSVFAREVTLHLLPKFIPLKLHVHITFEPANSLLDMQEKPAIQYICNQTDILLSLFP